MTTTTAPQSINPHPDFLAAWAEWLDEATDAVAWATNRLGRLDVSDRLHTIASIGRLGPASALTVGDVDALNAATDDRIQQARIVFQALAGGPRGSVVRWLGEFAEQYDTAKVCG